MPMDSRGIDLHDIGWVNRELQKLRREIEALRSERRAAATTISDGDLRLANGAQLVVDGGDVVMLDEDGSVMFRIGVQDFGDRGVSIFRDTGELAFSLRKVFANSTEQSLTLYDRYGHSIFSEEGIGSGPARPLMHIPMQPVQETPGPLSAGPHGWEVEAADNAWATVFQARYARHNQFGTFRVHLAASDTTTAAEARVINAADGAHLGQFFAGPFTATKAAGTTDYTDHLMPGIVLPGAPWASVTLELQVRRTAGTGSVRCAVSESRGGTS